VYAYNTCHPEKPTVLVTFKAAEVGIPDVTISNMITGPAIRAKHTHPKFDISHQP
jgi:hypothetical protein